MNNITTWNWYCLNHDSFGMGQSENEVEFLSKAHEQYNQNSEVNCRIIFKQHIETNKKRKTKLEELEPSESNSYVTRIKKNFGRAWQKWDRWEDLQLRENFDSRKDLRELTSLHQRAEGGIVSRLKKLKLLDEDIDTKEAEALLANRHKKLIERKTYASKFKLTIARNSPERYERGKESLNEFGMVNPPPVPHPDLRHTSLFICSICEKPVVGNNCMCRE